MKRFVSRRWLAAGAVVALLAATGGALAAKGDDSKRPNRDALLNDVAKRLGDRRGDAQERLQGRGDRARRRSAGSR